MQANAQLAAVYHFFFLMKNTVRDSLPMNDVYFIVISWVNVGSYDINFIPEHVRATYFYSWLLL